MAWDFDYTDGVVQINAGDLSVWDGLTTISLHTWCYLRSRYNTVRHTLASHWNNTDSKGWWFYFDDEGTNGKFRIPKLLVSTSGTWDRVEGGADDDFPTDQWCQFGGSWLANDANGLKVYINGAIKGTASSTDTGSFPALTATTYLGRHGGSSTCWDGYISEFAAWDVVLTTEEWEALGAGVPAYAIRPTNLIMFTPLQALQNPDWYWLPEDDTIATFSHDADVDTPVYPEHQYGHPGWSMLTDDIPGSTSTPTWGPWGLVKAHVVDSDWRDTTVENGETYKYKVLARDTSDNESAFSTESASVTPQAGIQGDPLPPPVLGDGLRGRLIRARRGLRTGM